MSSSTSSSGPASIGHGQAGGQAASSDTASPIWQQAIERYYSELRKGGIKGTTIDKDLWSIKSPLELLEQIEQLGKIEIQNSRPWLSSSVSRFEPILLHLDSFVNVTARMFGMNGRVSAIVWGSICMILKIAQPMLPDLLDMFEQLQSSLPRYKIYEQELQMTPLFETALCDLYTEVIIFCARAITFFRNNPRVDRTRKSWVQFKGDFQSTFDKLKDFSKKIDEEADLIRINRESISDETISMIRDLGKLRLDESVTLPCHQIPYGLNPRFFSRAQEVIRMKKVLDSPEIDNRPHILAICGIGGVGKTQLALHYANTSLQDYDLIAWIPSETNVKLMHALSELAKKLGLHQDEGKGDDYQSAVRVKDWLNLSACRFLLVFDNVERLDAILQVWPSSPRGSILITTRSPTIASKRASEVLRLEPFTDDDGVTALHSLTGIEISEPEDEVAAKEICRLLGGLPLAFVQMSDFIRARGYSLPEFLRVYKKSAARVHGRTEKALEYEHTLMTVWDLSFEQLSDTGRTLLNLAAFFDPDGLEESTLLNTEIQLEDNRLEFLQDEFDYHDALSSITGTSLVTRSAARKCLSVHRLVQATVVSRLTSEERIFYLDFAVRLISSSFPNHWRETGHQQGHGWESWVKCGMALPHALRLISVIQQEKIVSSDASTLAELMFRIGTYLWEKEQPTLAQSVLSFGLSLGLDRQGALCNPAVRMLGHICLDRAQPNAALRAYHECLDSRIKLVGPDVPAIADVLDSIACSYTEIGSVDKSFAALEKATRIHESHDPKRMGRTVFILAMNYLRAEKPEAALEALRHCWDLQGLTQEQVAQSRYPKHSGDLVLLSRIYRQQGKREEALQLASKTISIRKDVLGKMGPRVADSMFTVAEMLRADHKYALAAKLLREIIDQGQGMVEMLGHVSRALWTLASLEDDLGETDRGPLLREEAKETRARIEGKEAPDKDTVEAFARLVPWLLP